MGSPIGPVDGGGASGSHGRPPAGELPENDLHGLLGVRDETVAVGESLTGGLVAQRLSAVPGASRTFRGGVVAYATDLKVTVLGVPDALLAQRGAVDPEVAFAMAAGARHHLGATYGIGLTGVAGPSHAEGKLPGTIHVALAGPGGERAERTLRLSADRASNRDRAATSALELLRHHLRDRG